MPRKGLRHGDVLGAGERISGPPLPRELPAAGSLGGARDHRHAVVHDEVIGLAGAIPFEHGELGMMQRPALAVAEDARELDDARFACSEELLAGKLRRGAQETAIVPARIGKLGRKRLQMDLIAGGHLQRRGLDLDEVKLGEIVPQRPHDLAAHAQHGPALGVDAGRPRWGRGGHQYGLSGPSDLRKLLARPRRISMLRPETGGSPGHP